MKVCSSCGRQNPDDRDFCECGNYMRWEPTVETPAVTPEILARSAEHPAAAAPPPPAPAPPPAANAPARPSPPPPRRGPEPPPPPPAAAAPAPAPPEDGELAVLALRLADEEPKHGEPLALGVVPGVPERALALVRNRSQIVDNYDLSVRGLPESWASVRPATVFLVPQGSPGTCEQEVEILFHPPRSPEAEARVWELEVVASSHAHKDDAATAPVLLGIQAYEDIDTRVSPERVSGRRSGAFAVAVENRANAPVLVGCTAQDPDQELATHFDPPTAELEPGTTETLALTVRPPRPLWIGRPLERRLEVETHTGEAAAALNGGAPGDGGGGDGGDGDGGDGDGAGLAGVAAKAGIRPPKVAGPRLRAPSVSVGPSGVKVRPGAAAGPAVRPPSAGPMLGGKPVDLTSLRVPSRGGGPAADPAAMPRRPTQAAFRQKPWLPWWLPLLLVPLLLLALLLFLFLPRGADVPQVVGERSVSDAEAKLVAAGLTLAPETREVVSEDQPPGTVVRQIPEAGERAEEGDPVTVEVAVGSGRAQVPEIVGMTPEEAEAALVERRFTLGAAEPQPLDPEGAIESQIPVAGESRREGTPVAIFLEPARGGGEGAAAAGAGAGAGAAAGGAGEEASAEGEAAGEEAGGEEAGAAGGEGGEAGGEIEVPPIDDQDEQAYGQRIGELGLIPEVTRVFDDSVDPGTLFATRPEEGETVAAGSRVELLVSAGLPLLAYHDDEDVLLLNAANGEPERPIASGPGVEKDPTWNFDGTRVAYVGGGQVFVDDREDRRGPVRVTSGNLRPAHLAWAPTSEGDVFAMAGGRGDDLCLGRLRDGRLRPSCIEQEGLRLVRTVRWAPDGRAILALGQEDDKIGIVRYTSREPFSADRSDWRGGRFVTETGEPGRFAIDAALSPDGKRLAVVANFETGAFQVYLADDPTDFALAQAEPLPVDACKVAWRPDGQELVVVRGPVCVGEQAPGNGPLVRVPLDDPARNQVQLGLAGDDPVYQPILPTD